MQLSDRIMHFTGLTVSRLFRNDLNRHRAGNAPFQLLEKTMKYVTKFLAVILCAAAVPALAQGAVGSKSGAGAAVGHGVAKGQGVATGTGVAIGRDQSGHIQVRQGTGTVSGKGVAIGKGGVAGAGTVRGHGKARGAGRFRTQ